MVCFKCGVQMHQYKRIGNGSVSPDGQDYWTWKIEKCPNCGTYVYRARGLFINGGGDLI